MGVLNSEVEAFAKELFAQNIHRRTFHVTSTESIGSHSFE